MKKHERVFFVNRIRCGWFYLSNKCKFSYPDKDVYYEADHIYNDVYNRCEEEKVWGDSDVLNLIVDKHDWKFADEEYLIDYSDMITDMKIDLYNNWLSERRQISIREEIKNSKEKFAKLYNIRHQYDYLTIEGISEISRMSFIVEEGIKKGSKKVNCPTFSSAVLSDFYSQQLTDEDFRELANNDPWIQFWAAGEKNSLFDKPSIDLNEEQLRIISWSNLYENVRSAHDSPSEEIISDHDMLDGWLAVQRKNRESDKSRSLGESKLSNKMKSHQNVFLPVNSKRDALKVKAMNTPQSTAQKNSLIANLKKHGEVKMVVNDG